MFFIFKTTSNMWLLGYQDGFCGVPTCIWGERWQDAKPFQSRVSAQQMADQIGYCEIIYKEDMKDAEREARITDSGNRNA